MLLQFPFNLSAFDVIIWGLFEAFIVARSTDEMRGNKVRHLKQAGKQYQRSDTAAVYRYCFHVLLHPRRMHVRHHPLISVSVLYFILYAVNSIRRPN